MSSYDHRRAVRILTAIFGIAVAVSIVHYTDNYVNYSDFPQASGGPSYSKASVAIAWVAFTAAGLAGYLLFRRAPSTLALALLAVYSGSGLIGIGHYTVSGATSMPFWRQVDVGLDIVSGIALFTFVIWATRARSARPDRGRMSEAEAPRPG